MLNKDKCDRQKAIYTKEKWAEDKSFMAKEGQEVEYEVYTDMLCCLPPHRWERGAFLVGEPYSYNKDGEFTYSCFQQRNESYYYIGRLSDREFDEMIESED